MPTKSFYLKEALAGTSGYLSLQDGGTAPATAIMTTGWIVGTLAATRYARMDALTERASSAHVTTPVEPSGVPDNTLGDSFRTETVYTGNFVAGNWVLTIPVRGETRATSTHDGRLRVRIWRSTSQTGASPTELTGAVLVTSLYTDLNNTTPQSLSVTWAASAFSLSAEYLFVQIAHELTGAGSNANSDTHLMSGTSTLTTPDFTDTGPQNFTSTQTDSLGGADPIAARDLGHARTTSLGLLDPVVAVAESFVSVSDAAGFVDAATSEVGAAGVTHEVVVRNRVVVT